MIWLLNSVTIFIMSYIVLYTSLQINMKGNICYISKFVTLTSSMFSVFAKMFIFVLSVILI